MKLKQFVLEWARPERVVLPPDVARLVDDFGVGTADGRGVAIVMWAAMRRLFLQAAFFSLLSALAASGSVVVGMQILRIKAEAIAPPAIAACIALFFACGLLAVYANMKGNRYRGWLGVTSETLLAHHIAVKLESISHAALRRLDTGNLKVLVNSDARNVANFVNIAVRNVLPALTASLVAVPLLAWFTGWAGVAGFATMLLLIPISTLLGRRSAIYQGRIQATLDHLTGLTAEWVGNIRLIRYLAWEAPVLRDLRARMRRLTLLSMKQSMLTFVASGLSISWWMISIAAVALTSRFLDVPIDLAQFFGAIWLITLLHGYLMHIPTTIRFYAQASTSFRRLNQFLAEPDQDSHFLAPQEIALGDSVPAYVHFEKVDFYFDPARPVLRSLDFTLDLSKRTVLVGEVGTGKTTLLQLLAGIEVPVAGRIVVEFADGRKFDLLHRQVYDAFRAFFALVPQEAFISGTSVCANITLDPTADEADALAAAHAAELAADLEQLGGVHTDVGEGGINLSGGQRQRINLARAYFSRRAYLLLDDPTSALDHAVENRIRNGLMRTVPFLMVTNRLANLSGVDEILVLKDGHIVEQGSYDMLSASGSQFHRMLRAYAAPAHP